MVATNNGEYTMSDIYKRLHMNPATTYNLLENLVSYGFLEKDPAMKKYAIGPKLLNLLNPLTERESIINSSAEVLKELSETLEESVILAIFHNGERYVIASAEYKNHLINVNLNLFQKSTCYDTATGRILLSNLSEKELKNYIEKHGLPGKRWSNISSFSALKRELEKIRKNQVSIKKDSEVAAIAVSVSGIDENSKAAIGVYLPTTRFTVSKKRQIIRELRKAAKQIAENLKKGLQTDGT